MAESVTTEGGILVRILTASVGEDVMLRFMLSKEIVCDEM